MARSQGCGQVLLEFKQGETNWTRYGRVGFLNGRDSYGDYYIYRTDQLTVAAYTNFVQPTEIDCTEDLTKTTTTQWPTSGYPTNLYGGFSTDQRLLWLHECGSR